MRLLAIAAFVMVQCSLHAAWRDLKPEFDRQQTIAAIGAPLFLNKSRGYETWTYDHGAWAAFENGHLREWHQPLNAPPQASAARSPRNRCPASANSSGAGAPSR